MSSSSIPATIYHLAKKSDWEAAVNEQRDYYTESLEKEGITHASSTTDLLLDIGNSFYKDVSGGYVLLHIKTEALKSAVKMVQANAPLPVSSCQIPPICPHISGPIDIEAVFQVSIVHRDANGTFLSIEGI